MVKRGDEKTWKTNRSLKKILGLYKIGLLK
jgi:hypothetical protein